MSLPKLPSTASLVPTGAVAVVVAGGFLSACAPVAKLALPKWLRRIGEPGLLPCILLSHDQRKALEETPALAAAVSYGFGVRCFKLDHCGTATSEQWGNGCAAWVAIGELAEAIRKVDDGAPPAFSTWSGKLARELVNEAEKAAGLKEKKR